MPLTEEEMETLRNLPPEERSWPRNLSWDEVVAITTAHLLPIERLVAPFITPQIEYKNTSEADPIVAAEEIWEERRELEYLKGNNA